MSDDNEPGEPAALELWASFPVDAVPRPLVLTGPDILNPASGFTGGEDKWAYISGSFELRTTLPIAPVTVAGQLLSSAAEALAEFRSEDGTEEPGTTSLAITGVELSTGTFSTDRGVRELPAWSFRFDGVAEPALVLAIPAADRWPRPGMPTNDGRPAERISRATAPRSPCRSSAGQEPARGRRGTPLMSRKVGPPWWSQYGDCLIPLAIHIPTPLTMAAGCGWVPRPDTPAR